MNSTKRTWFRPASWLRVRGVWKSKLSRRMAYAALGGAGLIGLAAVPYSMLTAQSRPQPQAGTETRTYVLQLLTDLHSQRPDVVRLAEQRLRELGVAQDQLQYARLLKSPDRFERFRLVSQLPQIREPLQTELRIELTRDPDREVRASVLNMTQPEMLTGPVASRLDEMRRSEPDPAIRQRVEQLSATRSQSRLTGQSPPALNLPDARPMPAMQSPLQEQAIEIHAQVHRPVDAAMMTPGVSFQPPGPAGTPATIPTVQPVPIAGVPLTPPSPSVSPTTDQPAVSVAITPVPVTAQMADAPAPRYTDYQSRRPSTVQPPQISRTEPAAANAINAAAPIQQTSSLPILPLPLPNAGPERSAAPVGNDILPVAVVSPEPLPLPQTLGPSNPVRPRVSVEPTLFERLGTPPPPVPGPPPENETGSSRLVPQSEPGRLVFPNTLPVPAPAPAPVGTGIPQPAPGVPAAETASVFPLFDRPSGSGQVVINDPLFQKRPGDGPTSSDDVGARRLLDRPIDQVITPTPPQMAMMSDEMLTPEPDAPFGFTGPSGIIPTEVQTDPHFVPVEDRWRLGYEFQDRYGPLIDASGWKWGTGYLGVPGHWWDPYNQNVLKGDYPIIGQHTFMNMMLTSQSTFDFRQTPTGTTPFESTRGAHQEEFFGNPESTSINQNFFLRFDLFHANNLAFKPLDWQFRITPTINSNVFHSEEFAVINPDVRQGRNRIRDHFVLQEYFAEFKLADLSPDYDFVSVRTGNQLFNSDFRGFIFFDTNRAVRIFGSRFSNRHQFNLLFYDTVEKETNSQLNTTKDRHQNILIANYYVQDFIWPGYTFQTSFHWNNDQPSREFDRNDFLVRPDPTGVFQPHRVEAYYFGIAGDGHIGRINVNNAFYWVTGRDGLNPIAGRTVDINAFMGALELSYDRDWARFRTSLFYSSGDDNPSDTDAEGFDSILDNPVFVGGEFSYWQRQAIQLFGVRLVNDRSLVPDLRSSGIQGQSNFVNPGLFIFNLGLDMDLTPKLRSITNANYIMFDETEVLATYTFQGDIDKEVGLDISTGFEWRPFHNDNAIILFGMSALIPDEGFKDLYNEFANGDTETLFAAFADVILTY